MILPAKPYLYLIHFQIAPLIITLSHHLIIILYHHPHFQINPPIISSSYHHIISSPHHPHFQIYLFTLNYSPCPFFQILTSIQAPFRYLQRTCFHLFNYLRKILYIYLLLLANLLYPFYLSAYLLLGLLV